MSDRTVLLIDDDPETHRLVEHYLEGLVESMHFAADATSGIEVARSTHPALILLDFELPDGDGLGVLQSLRADPATREIPVLFLTVRSDRETMIRALEGGAVDYVTKPFDVPVFQARVRSALRSGQLDEARGLHSVLIIDDDPDVHRIVEKFLASDAEVLHAFTPDEGVRQAQIAQPSVILLDLELPGRNGLQVCRELTLSPRTAAIPVVIITSDSGAHRMVAGLERGAVDYLVKPIDREILRARVRTASRRGKSVVRRK